MLNVLFNWCLSPNDDFDISNGEAIIGLEITQKEGCFASAKVLLKSKSISKPYAKIVLEKNGEITPLFFGKVVSFPIANQNSLVQVELLAEPQDYQQQLENFSNDCIRKNPDLSVEQSSEILRDDLFFSSLDKNNPTTFLEGNNFLFYWNMKTGKLSLSSIKHGERTFSVFKKNIIQNSLKVRLAREPYGKINVNLSADWIQSVHGFVDLIPAVASMFDFNRINSFTDISAGFKNFVKDGYSVIYKKINKVNPNNLGILTDFPLTSPDIKIGSENIRFRRFYFDGNFIVGWEYQQKRKESISFSLINKKYSRTKDININLNAIQSSKDSPQWRPYRNYFPEDKVIYKGNTFACLQEHNSSECFINDYWKKLSEASDALNDDSLDSFFATPRGKNCIQYSFQKAIALLNYSRRYVFIDLSLDANKFWNLSVNDEVCLEDVSDKKIIGKVINTKLILNGSSRILKLTLGYAPDGFVNCSSPKFEIENEKNKPQLKDIITNIEIINPPEDQQKLLASQTFESEKTAKNFLKQYATKIRLKFRPLNVKREICRNIRLPNVEI